MEDRTLKMDDWSSAVKWRISMAESRRRKSSASFFPFIPQSPPCVQNKKTSSDKRDPRRVFGRVVTQKHWQWWWSNYLLPGWGNSRFQLLVDRRPASAAKEDLPASRRRCDSSSHFWPEADTPFTATLPYTEINKLSRPLCQLASPERRCGIFPADTERLWHHWSYHWENKETENTGEKEAAS